MTDLTAEEQAVHGALHDATCQLPEHAADPRCRPAYWRALAKHAVAALDLPGRDARIRAQVAGEIGVAIEAAANQYFGSEVDGLWIGARIAGEHATRPAASEPPHRPGTDPL